MVSSAEAFAKASLNIWEQVPMIQVPLHPIFDDAFEHFAKTGGIGDGSVRGDI